ncbi:hypothetical protein GCM10007216_10410 [Thalassobacillus devorans]|uniref:DUF302 domain-containing protein n=1 Tax=Thalassobacillus devorans TaxID=279813 RepID=A0ABQ1NSF2_9BACI|nr:DUF302 domain-containing protein [Thalassobacillus devorans]NIK29018.1 uncharacterized protein (DUF302 family) [Thalassobacillus devorans]GGC81792.1 hypothetical protein GCM10007216_10410 [Thalassobacillus devorans]
MFHYTVETNKTMDEAVQALEAELKNDKFGVLWDFDVKATLNNKGLDFDKPVRILEVCNPGEAKKVLEKNELVSYFLPCKIVVHESDGMTKIGMPKPTKLIEFVEDQELNQIAEDIEQRMINAINEAK